MFGYPTMKCVFPLCFYQLFLFLLSNIWACGWTQCKWIMKNIKIFTRINGFDVYEI